VWLRTDPSPEPVRPEAISGEVHGLERGIAIERLGVRRQRFVGAGLEEILLRHVPLALVVGVVPAGAEPLAHRRHGRGVEPEDVRLVGALRDARSLRDPVQRRVLAGDERSSARDARGRHDVVVPELHAVRAQRNLRREVGVTPGLERRRLVHRRLPLLVDDHDEEVRAAAQLPARRERLRLCLRISRSGTDRQRRRSRAGGAQSLQHLTARDVVARAHGPHPLRPIERPPASLPRVGRRREPTEHPGDDCSGRARV
jgi:hypothetical protein